MTRGEKPSGVHPNPTTKRDAGVNRWKRSADSLLVIAATRIGDVVAVGRLPSSP